MPTWLPVVAALVPLLITPGLLFYFDVTPKVIVLLVGAGLALFWWRGEVPWHSRAGRWFTIAIGALLAVLVLTTTTSVNPALSMIGGNWRRFGLIPFAAVLVFAMLAASDVARRHERAIGYLRALVASGTLIALYAIAQYFGWDPLIPAAAYHAGDGVNQIVRPPGTMGHASYLATYLTLVLFASVAISKTRVHTILAVIAATAIVLTGTRAAILGALCGALAAVVMLRFKPSARRLAAAALTIGLSAAFVWSPAGEKLRARAHWSSEDALGGARLLLWRDSLSMSSHRWLLGFGPETFGTEFGKYESLELARRYPDFQHESPHNVYLDLLLSSGVMGGALLLLLSAIGLHAAWRARGKHAMLGAALVAQIVSQQFTSFTLPTALCFFLTIALLVGLQENPPSRPSFRWRLLLLIPLGSAFFFHAVNLGVADLALAQANAALSRGDVRAAITRYDTAERWFPAGSSPGLYFSRAFATAGTDLQTKLLGYREAVRIATSATQSAEDRQNAYYNLAVLLARQNDAPAVERNLRSAIEWSPNWFKPHWTLAQLLRAEGRIGEAGREAAVAVECDGGKHPEVTRTLEQFRVR